MMIIKKPVHAVEFPFFHQDSLKALYRKLNIPKVLQFYRDLVGHFE